MFSIVFGLNFNMLNNFKFSYSIFAVVAILCLFTSNDAGLAKSREFFSFFILPMVLKRKVCLSCQCFYLKTYLNFNSNLKHLDYFSTDYPEYDIFLIFKEPQLIDFEKNYFIFHYLLINIIFRHLIQY